MSQTAIGQEAPLLSVVTPAYNEEANVPEMYLRLKAVLEAASVSWEWLVVDDHSRDQTFRAVEALARTDQRVAGLRLSRNFGSHAALSCGLHHARGQCVVLMAADLQDPPEVIPDLLAQWRQGSQVVWAVRASRAGEKTSTTAFARLYYAMMRNLLGMKEMPATGADFLLMDRLVVDNFNAFQEQDVSILALISWMGFRQGFIEYHKQARLHGRSNWTLKKKLKLAVDSVAGFSYLPVRLMSYAGVVLALLGFLYLGVVIWNRVVGTPAPGWTETTSLILLLGGMQMLMLGILGEYTWRALSAARRRPVYLIEAMAGRFKGQSPPGQAGEGLPPVGAPAQPGNPSLVSQAPSGPAPGEDGRA